MGEFGAISITETDHSFDVSVGDMAFGYDSDPSVQRDDVFLGDSIDPFATDTTLQAEEIEFTPQPETIDTVVIYGDVATKPSFEKTVIASAYAAKDAAIPNSVKSETPANTPARSDTRTISVSPDIEIVGKGSAISREVVETSLRAEDDPRETRECAKACCEYNITDTEIPSAERFAGIDPSESDSSIPATETGAFSLVYTSASQPEVGTSSVDRPTIAGNDAKPETVEIIRESAPAEATSEAMSPANAKPDGGINIAKSAQNSGFRAFISSNIKARSSSSTQPAVFEALVSHLGPISAIGSASVIAAVQTAANPAPRFTVTTAANGVTQITTTIPTPNGGQPIEINFVQNAGGMQFSGVQSGQSMGGAAAIFLPVPSLSPAGHCPMPDMYDAGQHGDASLNMTEREISELDLEDEMATLIIEQLRAGPEHRGMLKTLRRLNAYLHNNDHSENRKAITAAKWKKLIHRAIGIVIRSIPLFDDRGLRSTAAIQHDVVSILGMELTTFMSWEHHYNVDLVPEQLVVDHELPTGNSFEDFIGEHMSFGIKKRLSMLAKTELCASGIDPALGMEGEANLQWGIAAASTIENSKKKVETALDYLIEVHGANKNAACKGIALIVKHSALTKRFRGMGNLFPRWNEAEVSTLIKDVMLSDIWEIMGHRALRKHFADNVEVNRFLNEAVFSANYAKAMRDLGKLDVTQMTDEEFWSKLDETGVGDKILEEALNLMGQRFN